MSHWRCAICQRYSSSTEVFCDGAVISVCERCANLFRISSVPSSDAQYREALTKSIAELIKRFRWGQGLGERTHLGTELQRFISAAVKTIAEEMGVNAKQLRLLYLIRGMLVSDHLSLEELAEVASSKQLKYILSYHKPK